MAAGSSLWVAALTVMAMDVRHVLYGPSLRSRIRSALDKENRPRAFGLTDEVAAAGLVRDNRRWSENWMLGLALPRGHRCAARWPAPGPATACWWIIRRWKPPSAMRRALL